MVTFDFFQDRDIQPEKIKTDENSSDSTKDYNSLNQESLTFDYFLDENSGEYCCNSCSYKSKIKSNALSHLRTHSGIKPFRCMICQYSCSDRSALKRHERVHTGERPNKCELCNSSFTRLSFLRLHMRTHTGEKPFKCEICESRFTQKGALKTHMRHHTGEKDWTIPELTPSGARADLGAG